MPAIEPLTSVTRNRHSNHMTNMLNEMSFLMIAHMPGLVGWGRRTTAIYHITILYHIVLSHHIIL